MPSVFGLYANSSNPLSALIRLKTYGHLKSDGFRFSHSALILEPTKELITPDSVVIESTLKHGGVKFTTLKSFISRSAEVMVTEYDKKISFEQYNAIWDVSKQIEGAPYDLRGVIGLGIGEDWQEDDCFFCSEAKAYILKNAKIDVTDWQQYELGRITPKDNLSWPQHRIDLDFI